MLRHHRNGGGIQGFVSTTSTASPGYRNDFVDFGIIKVGITRRFV